MPSLVSAIALFLWLSLHASFVFADSGEDCDAAAITGGHLGQVQCMDRRIRALDVELNRVYQLSLAAMPKNSQHDIRKGREQLRKSQRAWLKYKDENCDLIGGLRGGSNLWVTDISAQCGEKMTRDRIVFLKSIVDGSDKP